MEWIPLSEGLLRSAALLGALASLCGAILACYRFYIRQQAQDRELTAIREELIILCYGIQACLDGLHQQGCNSRVTDALNRLDKHLNRAAHKGESAIQLS